MLCSEKKITDKEKSSVKDAACSLLERLKNNEFKVNQWTEKIQTSSAVKRKINLLGDLVLRPIFVPLLNEYYYESSRVSR